MTKFLQAHLRRLNTLNAGPVHDTLILYVGSTCSLGLHCVLISSFKAKSAEELHSVCSVQRRLPACAPAAHARSPHGNRREGPKKKWLAQCARNAYVANGGSWEYPEPPSPPRLR